LSAACRARDQESSQAANIDQGLAVLREGFTLAEGLEAACRLSHPELSLEAGASIIEAYAQGKRGCDHQGEEEAGWKLDLNSMAAEVKAALASVCEHPPTKTPLPTRAYASLPRQNDPISTLNKVFYDFCSLTF